MRYLILFLIFSLTTGPLATPARAQAAPSVASDELTLKVSRSPLTKSEVDQYLTALEKWGEYVKARPKEWQAMLDQGDTARLWSKIGIKGEDMSLLSAKINLAAMLSDNANYVAEMEKSFKLKEEALARSTPQDRAAMRKRMDIEREFIRNLKKSAPESLKVYKAYKPKIEAANERLNRQIKPGG